MFIVSPHDLCTLFLIIFARTHVRFDVRAAGYVPTQGTVGHFALTLRQSVGTLVYVSKAQHVRFHSLGLTVVADLTR